MAILEMLAVAGRALTAVDVQKATGLPRPTCYRLLQTLIEHRLIEDPDGNAQYVIGDRLIRIALLGKSDFDLCRACAPALKSAAIKFGETVFLARFRSRHVEIIHVEMPADVTRGFIHPGLGARPMHACSCSKAIAAFAEEEFREEILSGDLKAFTEHTETSADALRTEFGEIIKLGYAECDQEIEIGVSSVAAPVRIGHIGASFSVGAVGPMRRLDAENRRFLGKELKLLSTKVGAAIQLCNLADLNATDLPLPGARDEEGKSLQRQH